jgi:hypothetical protein
MADMNAFWPKLARHALGKRPQRVFATGEGGKPSAPRRLAVAPVKRMVPRPRASIRLAASLPKETSERAHLPDLPINAGGGFGDAETHIAADAEDDDRERPDVPFDPVHQRRNGVFVARIGMDAGDRLAFGLNRSDEGLEVAAPARGDDMKALACKAPGNSAAKKVAGPDHQRRFPLVRQYRLQIALAGRFGRPILES